MLNILFFAGLQDTLNTAEEALEYHSGLNNVASLRDSLIARGEPWDALQSASIKFAVNQDMAFANTPIKDGDEIAFFPPVTGG